MESALWLLFLAGPIGAIDVIYFHLWKFRLYRRPESRGEEITHILRGIIVPTAFVLLLAGQPQGTLFWIVAALFFIDTVNSLIDLLIEPKSRAPIGVPPQELAVHFIGTTMMGAAWAAYMIGGWPTRNAPSALVPWPAGTLPAWLPSVAWGAVAISVVLVIVETVLVIRYARVQPAAG